MTKDATKVVVRLLPPEITMEQLEPTFGEAHLKCLLWKSFQAGKRYKGEAKPSRNSRCYIQFDTMEHAEAFVKDYHGHQFVDGHGETFRAVACFAPYQKVPRQKTSKDPRDGTIEDDATYKEFLEQLSKPKVYVAPEDPRLKTEDVMTTPLIEYMKTRAKERRERAERRSHDRKWKGYMDGIAEEPKKAKYRCSECGTTRRLEEDPDERGVFYCTPCWESWEIEAASTKKSKKKKKADKERYEETWEEEEDYSSKKKKKKRGKEVEEEWWTESQAGRYEEEDHDASRSRRRKDKTSDWSSSDWRWSSHHKDGGDSWWEEPGSDKKKKLKCKYKDSDVWWEDSYQESGSGGSRWRAKDEEDDKPRKSKKDKKSKSEEESGYWAPKSKYR